jgi:hypothetical protein
MISHLSFEGQDKAESADFADFADYGRQAEGIVTSSGLS